MKKSLWNLNAWNLKDVILSSILGAFFAAICLGTVLFVVGPITALLAPIGLGDLAFEFVFGVFFTSAVFAAYIMQKPGVATIVGFLTGLVQVFLGTPFAATVVMSGFIQGLGAEAGFALFGYKKYNLASVLMAATGATITSFILAWQRGTWTELASWIVVLRFAIRLISALVISGFFTKYLADKLARAGVLKSYPLGGTHEPQSD